MPVYQYLNGVGKLVELVRAVAQRDNVPRGLKRIPVPVRVGITGTSSDAKDPHSAEGQVPRAYRQMEERTGGREFLKEGGFSVDEVKEAWGM